MSWKSAGQLCVAFALGFLVCKVAVPPGAGRSERERPPLSPLDFSGGVDVVRDSGPGGVLLTPYCVHLDGKPTFFGDRFTPEPGGVWLVKIGDRVLLSCVPARTE